MIKYSGSNTITKMFQLFQSKLDSLAAVATTGSYNDLLDKPNMESKAPMYTYSTSDIAAGSSRLETGKLYFVYE